MVRKRVGVDQHLKQEIVGVYDRAAGLYEQVGIRMFTYYANLLVNLLDIPRGAQALDIATGRGALLFAIADQIGPHGHVLGVDLAPSMVAETAAEIQRRGLAHAAVELRDADTLNFARHSFDVITCGFALHFLDYSQLLPRLRQMLKPGGFVGTIHPYVPVDDQENTNRWSWLFKLTRDVFPPDFVPPAAWVAPNRLNRPDLIMAALHDAGFTRIQVTSEEVIMHFADEDDWWAWEWSQGSRFWLEGMSPEGLATFKRVSMERLRAMKTPQGIPIRLGALLAVARA
jgi:ubiquinone/menaquinone biosynthesis C-methylase UbiE